MDRSLGVASHVPGLVADLLDSPNVEGTAVYNANGDKLGSINDQRQACRQCYAAVDFGGLAGMDIVLPVRPVGHSVSVSW